MRSLLLLLCFVACTALAVAQVSSTQRQEFLEVHNNARLSSNLPRTPAQALPALVWSDELASIAQDFAFSCPGGTNPPCLHASRGHAYLVLSPLLCADVSRF